jgi:hypothetical protein
MQIIPSMITSGSARRVGCFRVVAGLRAIWRRSCGVIILAVALTGILSIATRTSRAEEQKIPARAGEGAAMTDPNSKATILREVFRKFGSGEKIAPAEFKEFVDAQNDGMVSGLAACEKIPAFALPDQSGKQRQFRDLAGPAGLLLVFTRSADW